MLRTTIVLWLVLLVLALNVVAFVTRIAEKCRLANRLSKCSETTISIPTKRRNVDLEAPTNPGHTSLGFASLAWARVGHLRSEKCESERLGGVTNGGERS
jgi:hypothetical protein